jgi:CheY-like chemotaxis protein
LHTDRQRLEQILKNLISNAIKFTSKGSITINVTSPRPHEVAFAIIDTGIGISHDKVEYIFEAFRQADGTTNRKYGGTGLGLTISRNLTKLLGGTLAVQSTQGVGSTFVLTMPVTPDTKVQSNPEVQEMKQSIQAKVVEATPTEAPRVLPYIEDDASKLPNPDRKVLLIVEDEVVFAKILMSMAREQKFLCLVAQTTEQGFELAKEHRPDAILLDMKLPDGSGLSLLDKLKENTRTRHIPVHVISSLDYSREALHLGAVGYLMKPADPENIKKTLGKLEEKIDQRMKKVLVVEDDEVQRKAISKLIEEKGVTILTVGTGKEALELLTTTQFDCVILDLTLPDISGFDLLENLAGQRDVAYPPVIVYTGKPLTQKEEEKLRRYSETIIIKGARSPERLLDEVALFLHQVESQLSEEKQTMLKTNRNPEKSFEGRKILLVDDDARNIFALMSILEHKGADVIVARNGLESLDKLKETQHIDLVLMDIMMPEMDGYTAIKAIRNDLMMTKLPIIAVTAKAMRDDYEKCLEAGANDYLAKPVDVEKLVSLMRVWLPRH